MANYQGLGYPLVYYIYWTKHYTRPIENSQNHSIKKAAKRRLHNSRFVLPYFAIVYIIKNA